MRITLPKFNNLKSYLPNGKVATSNHHLSGVNSLLNFGFLYRGFKSSLLQFFWLRFKGMGFKTHIHLEMNTIFADPFPFPTC